jgi:two-component system response regulator HydG
MTITVPDASPASNGSRSTDGSGKLHLLVVDQDSAVRDACCDIANGLGLAARQTPTAASARSLVRGGGIDILLLDLHASAGEEMDLLDETTTLNPELSVIVMSAHASLPVVVESMRTGAADYLSKPFAMEELTAVLERVAERRNAAGATRELRERLRSPQGLGNIIGRSPEMERLYRIVAKVAHSTHPVLILGEPGVGKELIARAIHSNGLHPSSPFIPVDCGSLMPEMIESELFGYAKGAFQGAARSKDGLLAASEGGTVLLDQVDELPAALQSKLARVLQEREVQPLGAAHRVPVKVRILAGTSRDLTQMVESGCFRKDLYYRLNVVNLRIPPLRERPSDIPLLAAHFLNRIARETGVSYTLSDETLRAMNEYAWPGNVGELENALERACTLSSGPVLHLADLPTQLQNARLANRRAAEPALPPTAPLSAEGEFSVMPLAEMEKQAILDALRKLGGDKLLAARLLGIGKTTLYRKLKEYGIESAEPVPSQPSRAVSGPGQMPVSRYARETRP